MKQKFTQKGKNFCNGSCRPNFFLEKARFNIPSISLAGALINEKKIR